MTPSIKIRNKILYETQANFSLSLCANMSVRKYFHTCTAQKVFPLQTPAEACMAH